MSFYNSRLEDGFYFTPLNTPQRIGARIIFFPFAGGNPYHFKTFSNLINEEIELLAVQLPGRPWVRNLDKAFSLESLLNNMLNEYVQNPRIIEKPFVIFGHSLGALIGFEFIKLLRKNKLLLPFHFIVSSGMPPHLIDKVRGKLLETNLQNYLRDYNGIPEEIWDNPEALDIFLKILNADFKFIKEYKYKEENLLDCAITAIGGMNDKAVLCESLQEWRNYTTSNFNIFCLPGDHFYFRHSQVEVANLFNDLIRAQLY
jgi:medium-chain acyl-[acyl-carrier-protein] hydrolase